MRAEQSQNEMNTEAINNLTHSAEHGAVDRNQPSLSLQIKRSTESHSTTAGFGLVFATNLAKISRPPGLLMEDINM